MTGALPSLAGSSLLRRSLCVFQQRVPYFLAVCIIGPTLGAAFPLFFWLYRTNGGTHQEPVLSWLPTIVVTLVASAFMLLGTTVSSAATVRIVASLERSKASEQHSQPTIRLWSIAGIVGSVLMRMILAGLLLTLLGAVALGTAAALGFNAPAVAGAIGFAVAGFWLLGTILWSVRIYARYALAIPTCILEGVGRKLAMQRSAYLAAPSRRSVEVAYGAFMVISSTVLASEICLLTRTHGVTLWAVEAIIALLILAVVSPIWTIAISLIYFHERGLTKREASRSSERVASVSI